jgi:hypothetical protein
MKTYKILGFIAAMVLTFAACETEVADPAGERGVGVVTTITDANPAIFVAGNLDDSYTEFVVSAEEGASYDDAYIVVSFNGVSQRTKVKDISSFPQTINITAAEAAAALGMTIADVESQDYFVFEVEVKVGSKIYRSNGGITVSVVCPFEPTLAFGNYTAISSSWDVNGDVTITVDPDDPYKIYVAGLAALDGLTEDLGPLEMIINPLNFEVEAVKTALASTAWSYTNFSYAGFGVFNSCTGDYQMTFAITVDQGSFGSYEFTIKRK